MRAAALLLTLASLALGETPDSRELESPATRLDSNNTAALLQGLDDDDPAVRDRAEAALIQAGPAIEPEVRAALAGASPEAEARIGRVLAWIGPDWATTAEAAARDWHERELRIPESARPILAVGQGPPPGDAARRWRTNVVVPMEGEALAALAARLRIFRTWVPDETAAGGHAAAIVVRRNREIELVGARGGLDLASLVGEGLHRLEPRALREAAALWLVLHLPDGGEFPLENDRFVVDGERVVYRWHRFRRAAGGGGTWDGDLVFCCRAGIGFRYEGTSGAGEKTAEDAQVILESNDPWLRVIPPAAPAEEAIPRRPSNSGRSGF